MRRFLIICLAAVFTLPAADAKYDFLEKEKDKTEKKEKKLSKYEKLFKDKKVETSKGLLQSTFCGQEKAAGRSPSFTYGTGVSLGSNW